MGGLLNQCASSTQTQHYANSFNTFARTPNPFPPGRHLAPFHLLQSKQDSHILTSFGAEGKIKTGGLCTRPMSQVGWKRMGEMGRAGKARPRKPLDNSALISCSLVRQRSTVPELCREPQLRLANLCKEPSLSLMYSFIH